MLCYRPRRFRQRVAPYIGAWIEIVPIIFFSDRPKGRSLHRSVD